MHTDERGVEATQELTAGALESARSLAQAIGESDIFRRFETAQDAFQADATAQSRLRAYQAHQQDLRVAAMWGGEAQEEQRALEREWQELSRLPTLQEYLQAQDALRELFRDVTGRITQGIGVDYGAACAPAGGCC